MHLERPKQTGGQFRKSQKKMGFSGFNFENVSEIFNEHAQLSARENVPLAQRDESKTFRYFTYKALTGDS